MKRIEKEEIALESFDRNPLILLFFLLLSGALLYWAYQLLKDVNPWGFIVMVPGAFSAFYTLWLFLNPFALIFDEKFEIKHSFLQHKSIYFVDIKNISPSTGLKLFITFNDDEQERVKLFGIKNSQLLKLKETISAMVSKNLQSRL